MKKILLLVLLAAVILCTVACDKEKEYGLQSDNTIGKDVEENNNDSDFDETAVPFQLNISFQLDDLVERAHVSLEILDRIIELSKDSDNGFAMCVVTVVDIDLSDVNAESSIRVPLTLRIEKIISKNNSCHLKEKDSLITADYSRWTKSEDEYLVSFSEGVVPITERSMQYIVCLTERSSLGGLSFDVQYQVSNYTIPIVPTYTSKTVAELCYAMRLPDDVRKLSYDLIIEEFGVSYIPSFSEIETEFNKLAQG